MGTKEGLKNYRLISCFGIPGKVMEQILLDTLSGNRERRALGTASRDLSGGMVPGQPD